MYGNFGEFDFFRFFEIINAAGYAQVENRAFQGGLDEIGIALVFFNAPAEAQRITDDEIILGLRFGQILGIAEPVFHDPESKQPHRCTHQSDEEPCARRYRHGGDRGT